MSCTDRCTSPTLLQVWADSMCSVNCPALSPRQLKRSPEWATQSPLTVVGNALDVAALCPVTDCIVTSPCYGNRMADHHDAKDSSRRITYKHKLGRDMSRSAPPPPLPRTRAR